MSRDNLTLSIQIFTLKEREAKNSNSHSGLIQLPISTIIPYTGTQMQLCKLTHIVFYSTIILLNHRKISQSSCIGTLQIIDNLLPFDLTFRNDLWKDLSKTYKSLDIVVLSICVSKTTLLFYWKSKKQISVWYPISPYSNNFYQKYTFLLQVEFLLQLVPPRKLAFASNQILIIGLKDLLISKLLI